MKKPSLSIERQQEFPGQTLTPGAFNNLVFNTVHFDKGFYLPILGDFTDIVIRKTGLYEFDLYANIGGVFDFVASGVEVNGQTLKAKKEPIGNAWVINQGKIFLIKGQVVRAQLAVAPVEGNVDPITSFHHLFSLVRVA